MSYYENVKNIYFIFIYYYLFTLCLFVNISNVTYYIYTTLYNTCDL